MTEKDRIMTERYIYEVIRRVSREQREGIGMELQELIDDMTEGGTVSREEVLTKLGDPAEFAKRYREEENYVIGPEYYDDFLWVLKIVLISVAASVVVSTMIQTMMGGVIPTEDLKDFIKYIIKASGTIVSDLLIAVVGAFGSVTLVFAILERQKVKVELKKKETWSVNQWSQDDVQKEYGKANWTPMQLAAVPHKKAIIKKGDCIATIVFIGICSALFIFAPYLIGARFAEGEVVQFIPLFNMDAWAEILPLLLAGLAFGFVEEVIKLVRGCYCTSVMVSTIICEIFQLVLAMVILKILPFWNKDFADEVSQKFGIIFHAKGDLMTYWRTDLISNIVLMIIFLAVLCEIGTAIYKTLKYSEPKGSIQEKKA